MGSETSQLESYFDEHAPGGTIFREGDTGGDMFIIQEGRVAILKTIDGVEMFVRQAAAQFELWTRKPAPRQLFDRIVREKLGG